MIRKERVNPDIRNPQTMLRARAEKAGSGHWVRHGIFRLISFLALGGILGLALSSCSEGRGYSGLPSQPEPLPEELRMHLIQAVFPEKIARIDSLLSLYHQRGGFHGNVLVAFHHQVLYHKSFGVADFDENRPLARESVFQLASGSKPFTAMAVLILKERGLLSLEDTLGRFFPGFQYGNLTVRHLLTHQSGLPNYMYLLDHYWTKPDLPRNQEVVDLMDQHNLPVWFPPGYRFNYSNTNYFLLASLVEKVSGMTFPEFAEANMFKPLGMSTTFVYSPAYQPEIPEADLVPGVYSPGRGRKIAVSVHDGPVGDKGVYSTTHDLFLWDEALYSGRLVSKSTLSEAFSPGVNSRGEEEPYGYGFRLRLDTFPPIAYHQGWWEGFRTSFSHRANDEILVVVLNHTSYKTSMSLASWIEDIISARTPDYPTAQLAAIFLSQGSAASFAALREMLQANPAQLFFPEKLRILAGHLRDHHRLDLANQATKLAETVPSQAAPGPVRDEKVLVAR